MKLYKRHEKKTPPFFSWGFHLFDKWLQIKSNGGSLASFFEDNDIHSIAVYGLGAIGRRLVDELSQGKIEVAYGIDRNAANIFIGGLTIKTLDDTLPEVDAVVVTPISFYEIEKSLHRKLGKDIDVIFIEDVVAYCQCKIRNRAEPER